MGLQAAAVEVSADEVEVRSGKGACLLVCSCRDNYDGCDEGDGGVDDVVLMDGGRPGYSWTAGGRQRVAVAGDCGRIERMHGQRGCWQRSLRWRRWHS